MKRAREEDARSTAADATYAEWKAEFEKTVCFVDTWEEKHCVLVRREVDVFGTTVGFTPLTRRAFAHLKFDRVSAKGKVVQSSFVSEWLSDGRRKSFSSAGFYPNPDECPKDEFNRFVPPRFNAAAANALPPDHPDFDAEFVDFVLEFILRVVIGGSPGVERVRIVEGRCEKDVSGAAQVVLDFLALNLQRYGDRARMLWLHGPDGCGKSAIANLLKGVLGPHLCCSGGKDGDAVLGRFNSRLKGTLLVDFGEIQKPLPEHYVNALCSIVYNRERTISERGKESRNYPIFATMIATCKDLQVVHPYFRGEEGYQNRALVLTCDNGSYADWDKRENGGQHFARMSEIEANVDANTAEWRRKFASLAGFLLAREVKTDIGGWPLYWKNDVSDVARGRERQRLRRNESAWGADHAAAFCRANEPARPRADQTSVSVPGRPRCGRTRA